MNSKWYILHTQKKENKVRAFGLSLISDSNVFCESLGTLSIDDGNGNGDGETEERLRRGRGCVAKLEAVRQAQYDDSFPRRRIKYDVFVKRSQKSILIMK